MVIEAIIAIIIILATHFVYKRARCEAMYKCALSSEHLAVSGLVDGIEVCDEVGSSWVWFLVKWDILRVGEFLSVSWCESVGQNRVKRHLIGCLKL